MREWAVSSYISLQMPMGNLASEAVNCKLLDRESTIQKRLEENLISCFLITIYKLFTKRYFASVSALHANFSELTTPSPLSFYDIAPPLGGQVFHSYLVFDFPTKQSKEQVWRSHSLQLL
jgi:hypothetical protein